MKFCLGACRSCLWIQLLQSTLQFAILLNIVLQNTTAHKSLVKCMLTLFPFICRYNFCDEFFGEQHMFYEIFSGICYGVLNFVMHLQSLSNRLLTGRKFLAY